MTDVFANKTNFRQGASSSSSSSSNPPVVLYVSDDDAYRNEVRYNLGQAGFSVVTTKSPAEALELAQESEFDALLSDYNLIQSDALTLFQKIKGTLGNATPPMLVMSDFEEEVLRSRCVATGTEGLHVKSESAELLIERVISIMRDHEKQRRIAQSVSKRHFKGGTDALTRVATQEHFSRRLNGESMASYRDHNFLSLLMIVLDQYERVVTQYGKQQAERALGQMARLIESELRSRDCVARYDDHTFAISLPDTPPVAVKAVGRRLRQKLNATEFGNLDQAISLTVSIGATTRPPGTRRSPQELCTQALLSAEAAQKMGGDRVVADTGLTGAPLVLVIGDPNSEAGVLVRVLAAYDKVEMRLATTYDDACKVLAEVPVAMLMAQEGIPGSRTGLDLLEWVRRKFPAIRRVFISDRVDHDVMIRAVNGAAINYFISLPVNGRKLEKAVEELLFS
jgi:diguanylate cyclase (GGDEF)-like protein